MKRRERYCSRGRRVGVEGSMEEEVVEAGGEEEEGEVEKLY
jgi:hypothetical protein